MHAMVGYFPILPQKDINITLEEQKKPIFTY